MHYAIGCACGFFNIMPSYGALAQQAVAGLAGGQVGGLVGNPIGGPVGDPVGDPVDGPVDGPVSAPIGGVLAHPLHRQHSRYPQPATKRLEDVPLAPVVVTAAPPDAGVVTVMDPHQARQPIPASDGADYLKTIPGFAAIRNGGSNGDPVLRGMFGSRLNILANGSAMLGACPGRMDPPTSYLSPDTFDKVTVIKGPETVLWGPMGSAGTVLFERTPPRFVNPGIRFHGSVLGGSAGRNDQLIDLSAGNSRTDVRVLAQKAHADDDKDGAGHRVPSRWDKWNVDTTLGVNLTPHDRIELDAGTGDGDARYAGRDMDGVRFKRDSTTIRFHHTGDGGPIDDIAAQVYVNDANHLMDNFSLRDPASANDGMAMSMASNVERFSVGGRAAVRLNLSDALQFTTGVDAESERHQSRFAMSDGGARMGVDYRDVPWSKDANRRRVGLFGQMDDALDSHDQLIAGIRLDHTEVRDLRTAASEDGGADASGSPEAPQTLHTQRSRGAWLSSEFLRIERTMPNGHTTLYAGLGVANRFPDYWELFSATRGGPPSPANDGILRRAGQGTNADTNEPANEIANKIANEAAIEAAKHDVGQSAFLTARPERTVQLDVGAHYHAGGNEAWLSAYIGHVSDFLLFDYGPLAGGPDDTLLRNVNARIWGGEWGGSVALNAHWKVALSMASAWGENTSDERALPQMPPLDSRLALTYRSGRWSAGALWRIVNAQHRIAVNEGNVAGLDFGSSPGFGVFSLNTGYAVSDTVTLNAGIDNLFDKDYTEHLNKAGSAGFGYPASTPFNDPGRTFWAIMKINV